MQKEIFISHASEDRELVDSLVNLLQTGANVQDEQIFCTSIPGMKIPNGLDFMDYIKKQIQSPKAIICLLTPNYFKSPFCMCEMGAAWAKTDVVVPLLVPPLSYSDIQGVLKTTQVSKINSIEDMNEFIQRLGSLLDVDLINISRWADQVARFVKNAPKSVVEEVNQPSERLIFREEIVKSLPWSKVKEMASTSVYIWAWSGVAALNERTRSTMKSLLKKGVNVRFMIMNPSAMKMASQYISMEAVCSWSEEEVQKDIARGKDAIIDFRETLSQDEKDYFHARETSWFMAWSGLAIDPNSNEGIIQVESYLYNYEQHLEHGNHLDYRPNLLLNKKSKFYSPYWLSVENMWKSASNIS